MVQVVVVRITRLVLGGKRRLPRPGCYSALLGLWWVGGAATVGGFIAVSNFRLRSLPVRNRILDRIANSFERRQTVVLWLFVAASPQLALRLISYAQ
jgi:hypothetical protein